jgi:RHS repeat-associated protein
MIGAVVSDTNATHKIGVKQYEMSNHLGNVLTVVSDKPLPIDWDVDGAVDCYKADIVSVSDYYPFGAPMASRTFSSPSYRYGFNDQEREDELEGNYAFEYRIHDPRLGRFLSIDPLAKKFPEWSPYIFSGNRIVDCRDYEGLEPADAKPGAKTLIIVIQGYGSPGPANGQTQAANDPNGGVDYGGLGDIETAYGTNPEIQVVVFSSSHSDNTINDASTTMKNFKEMNPDGQIIIDGHSLGADNAINICDNNPDIHVDLLITLDICDYWDTDNIPSNVSTNINIYQDKSTMGGEDTEADDPSKTKVLNLYDDKSEHTTIDNNWKDWVIQKIGNTLNQVPQSQKNGDEKKGSSTSSGGSSN